MAPYLSERRGSLRWVCGSLIILSAATLGLIVAEIVKVHQFAGVYNGAVSGEYYETSTPPHLIAAAVIIAVMLAFSFVTLCLSSRGNVRGDALTFIGAFIFLAWLGLFIFEAYENGVDNTGTLLSECKNPPQVSSYSSYYGYGYGYGESYGSEVDEVCTLLKLQFSWFIISIFDLILMFVLCLLTGYSHPKPQNPGQPISYMTP